MSTPRLLIVVLFLFFAYQGFTAGYDAYLTVLSKPLEVCLACTDTRGEQ